MGYTHLEITSVQTAKRVANPCGDVIQYERNPNSTIILCSDGLGSGIKANLAATLCVSRLLELLRREYSLRQAFEQVARTMNEARGTDMPYAVFSMMQFRHDGETTILSYDMPPPVYISRNTAIVLTQQVHVHEEAVMGESNCYIEPGEGIMLVSDGITQAGLGQGLPLGWCIEGVCDFIRDKISNGASLADIPVLVHSQARKLWRKSQGDDCSVVLGWCRHGSVVNIFTGPPANPAMDRQAVQRFMETNGVKIVCGATTAKIVATTLGKKVTVSQLDNSLIAPPQYEIEGIQLVTEGAVTLNQAYNILGENSEDFTELSGVTRLCNYLKAADRVNFFIGRAWNTAGADISFRQQGIIPRHTIIPLLAEKLRKEGKLVVMHEQ